MSTEEKLTLYHDDDENSEDMLKLKAFLKELEGVLLTRSDGIEIIIGRTDRFPQYGSKDLIHHVTIDTWDIAA